MLAELVPDELVHRVAVVRSPGECAAELPARLAALRGPGVLLLPGQDPPLAAIAELVEATPRRRPECRAGRAGSG